MKKLKKISLSKLNESQLDKKQQQLIFGGNNCRCGSCNTSTGPSMDANGEANHAGGITSTGDGSGNGGIGLCVCDWWDNLAAGRGK